MSDRRHAYLADVVRSQLAGAKRWKAIAREALYRLRGAHGNVEMLCGHRDAMVFCLARAAAALREVVAAGTPAIAVARARVVLQHLDGDRWAKEAAADREASTRVARLADALIDQAADAAVQLIASCPAAGELTDAIEELRKIRGGKL